MHEQKIYWENIKQRRNPFHPVVKSFAQPKVRLISEIIQTPKSSTLLEVGCGNGYFTVYLNEKWDVTGLDQSNKMLSMNPHKKLVQGTVDNLQFDDRSFDIVFSANLLHHIEKPLSAVQEMARVSKRFLVLIEPNRNNPLMFLFSRIKKVEREATKFSLKYLISLIDQTGLYPVFSCTHGSVVPNMTPQILLPFLNPLNYKIPMGFYLLAIAEKSELYSS